MKCEIPRRHYNKGEFGSIYNFLLSAMGRVEVRSDRTQPEGLCRVLSSIKELEVTVRMGCEGFQKKTY